ncbi:hypothetical protein [Azohydromonas australica]|uniref:hypothetical protein n=1 Tax=Azohydromonas australica TaxID=364039 RepID=UPI000424E19C|nr:hypothetical protein [Azohydromonas australica]
MKQVWVLLGAVALAGCAASGKAPPSGESKATAAAEAPPPSLPAPDPAGAPAPATPKVAKGVGSAVVSPLGDFNLLRDDIPPVLQAARAGPYQLPAAHDCAALAVEIATLDAALGPDLDAPASPDRPSVLERGVDEVGNAAVNAVQGAVSGAIPFRGWIRKLTGAERHAKNVAAAITAGSVRRAFLKGVALAQACPPPLPANGVKRLLPDAASLQPTANALAPHPR